MTLRFCRSIPVLLGAGILGFLLPLVPVKAQDAGTALGSVTRLPYNGGAYELLWTPDQQRIIIVGEKRLASYKLSTQWVEWTIPSIHIGSMGGQHAAFIDQGRHLLTSAVDWNWQTSTNMDAVFSVIDVATGRIVRTIRSDINTRVPPPTGRRYSAGDAFDVSADGKIAVASAGDSLWTVAFDTSSGRELWRIGPLEQRISRVRLLDLPRNRIIETGWRVEAWDIAANRRLSRFNPYGKDASFSNAILDPTTGDIIIGAMVGRIPGQPDDEKTAWLVQNVVQAWDPVLGRRIRTYPGPGANVQALIASPDGRLLFALKGRDIDVQKPSYVDAWDLRTGQLIGAANFGMAGGSGLGISPDGRRLAVSSSGYLNIIDLNPNLRSR
ncbi:hypothetical protein SAMN02745126_00910 [Enhydrobacter aerosaccus]|uniref:PQQ-like domain-containing protein n=1 Tax=Enhydrobacter aerosaccus TaxID=225324 RepID=A0A1T4KE07_9HYPH|nr:hypothetical protein [Enhydrobacter aerosaccus]SJZ40585.1 hypothetical protein SAMN02745126_00910 [Enhydrobacter aerosaccus]